jgi:nitrite reductase/ring-hydroxylating ferredoxin subunit
MSDTLAWQNVCPNCGYENCLEVNGSEVTCTICGFYFDNDTGNCITYPNSSQLEPLPTS